MPRESCGTKSLTSSPSRRTDLLIIGSGIAGCSAAIVAADAGLKVIILTKSGDPKGLTATAWAQGGIIYKGEGDSPQLLAEDIFKAGADFGYIPAIQQLAELGPRYVEQILIERLGVAFDRGSDQALDVTEEAAHSVRRIVHVADLTGGAIEQKLVQAVVEHENITVVTGATAVDLLTLSHHSVNPADVYEPLTCVGVYAFFSETGKVEPILAGETLLATGGLGQLFLHSTNPRGARGDGVAMAYRAGARLLNLEYIQFHPTALYQPMVSAATSQGPGQVSFLVSEAVRGEGGVIVGRDGKPFMEKYHPQGSLAPRDVVSRAIHTEMLEKDEPCAFLDITSRSADWIRGRFPNIHAKCMEIGIDMTRQPIPIVPAAHYACGGIAVDLQGRTSIRRLRAAGEVSCTGVHGANRLASTSLLEGLVWGVEAARSVILEREQLSRGGTLWLGAASLSGGNSQDAGAGYYFPEIAEWKYENEPVDPALVLQDWLTIKYTMWNYVGLVRTEKRMKRARSILRELQTEIEYFYNRARLSDEVIGLRNGAQAALAVLFAALENRTSRGGHYRTD